MQLPSSRVVSAFFESYLNLRTVSWKIKIDEFEKLPLHANERVKLQICLHLLTDIQKTKNLDDWVKVYLKLVKTAEEEYSKGKYNPLFNWIVEIYKGRPTLSDVCYAAASYILDRLKTLEEFAQYQANAVKASLDAEAAELRKPENQGKSHAALSPATKQRLEEIKEHLMRLAGKDLQLSHLFYFTEILVRNQEPDVIRLKETKFEDYEKNALKGARSDVFVQALFQKLAKDKKPAQQEEKIPSTQKIDASLAAAVPKALNAEPQVIRHSHPKRLPPIESHETKKDEVALANKRYITRLAKQQMEPKNDGQPRLKGSL